MVSVSSGAVAPVADFLALADGMDRRRAGGLSFLRPPPTLVWSISMDPIGVVPRIGVRLRAGHDRQAGRGRLNVPAEAGVAAVQPRRETEADGSTAEVFTLPTDVVSLEALLRDLFENHWQEITFGPIIQGSAWELRAPQAPMVHILLDGYLTVSFGVPYFHICIGEHKGPHNNRVSPELAQHRRTARAELYRLVSRDDTPVSWGVRLFNGKNEQQITILLPNPFLHPETDEILKEPDWSRLALWDRLRARWFSLAEPDPFDRSGLGFRHG
jgi:hypothetical protein